MGIEGKTGNEKKMTSALDYVYCTYCILQFICMYWRTSWTRSINKTGQIEKYLKGTVRPDETGVECDINR
jgi:hypothetical protein